MKSLRKGNRAKDRNDRRSRVRSVSCISIVEDRRDMYILVDEESGKHDCIMPRLGRSMRGDTISATTSALPLSCRQLHQRVAGGAVSVVLQSSSPTTSRPSYWTIEIFPADHHTRFCDGASTIPGFFFRIVDGRARCSPEKEKEVHGLWMCSRGTSQPDGCYGVWAHFEAL